MLGAGVAAPGKLMQRHLPRRRSHSAIGWSASSKTPSALSVRRSAFGQDVIRFADPDGLILELIASDPESEVEAWPESSMPAEHSLRGFHSVSAALEGYERSARLLTEVFGYELVKEEANRFRFAARDTTGPGRMIDLLCMPDTQHARGGAGTVHHIAFRTPDDASQRACREQLVELGFNVSPVMDRTYFHSIYFREPGGILFEIATDPPGLHSRRDGRGTRQQAPSSAVDGRGARADRGSPAADRPSSQAMSEQKNLDFAFEPLTASAERRSWSP